jgi:dimethylglycine dehydrogenase
MDLSSFAKFDVTGPGAEAFLDRLTANKLPQNIGGINLTHVLSDAGMIEGEYTITRFADDRFYILSGAGTELEVLDKLCFTAGEDVEVANVSDDFGMLLVAGPKSRDLLSKVTSADLTNSSFRWLSGQEIDVAGISCRALRVNYVGELGWELHAPMDQLETLYDVIWEAGGDLGIVNFGAYAINSLRMEKAYRGLGAELTNEITLIEADMERFYAPEKGHFQGRDATEARKSEDMVARLVYAEVMAGDCDIRGGEAVLAGDKVVGVCTSGGYGHATGKSLAFAYVEPDHAQPGAKLKVQILGEGQLLRVLSEPVWDPENVRQKV